MIEYKKDTIETMYSINPTNVLVQLVLDIKNGMEIHPEAKETIVNTISKLKAFNNWNYRTEERLIQLYDNQKKIESKLEHLTPEYKDIYINERVKKLKEYDYNL